MKIFIVCSLAILISFSLASALIAAQNATAQDKTLADTVAAHSLKDVIAFTGRSLNDYPNQYDPSISSALGGANLGHSFGEYMLPLNRLATYSAETDPNDLLLFANGFLYLVFSNGRAVTSFEVIKSKTNEVWEPSSIEIGSSRAVAVTRAADVLSVPGAEITLKYIEIPGVNLSLLARREGNDLLVTPLYDNGGGLEKGKIVSARKLFLNLKDEARRIIAAEKMTPGVAE